MEQTNTFDKKYNPEKWLLNAVPLTDKQKSIIQAQLKLMYQGLTLANWAKQGTKLGTAKLKALEQIETFAKTLGDTKPGTPHKIITMRWLQKYLGLLRNLKRKFRKILWNQKLLK